MEASSSKSFDLTPEEERAALTDPRFADALLEFDFPLALIPGYGAGAESGFLWLIEANVAVQSNAVEIAQALLRDDGPNAIAAWNRSAMRWLAKAMTRTEDATWQVSGTGGQELTIRPDGLREFLLDLQRFLVNAGARGAALLQ